MKPLALIIEDDPAIREALANRLESLGHDYQAVGSHSEACERIDRSSFSYILLDLEIPYRFGRPPSIQIGKNVLLEIRGNARNRNTPVIVVTAHGHDRPDLAVDVMKAGATDFVKKPFDNLELAIREALQQTGNDNDSASSPRIPAPDLRPLGNGRMLFQRDEIEFEGIPICTRDSGAIWRVLQLLRERKANGQPKPFPGKKIADALGLCRGQNAVCDAVSAFRRRVVQLLEEAGIHANEDSVIITGKAGYQINAAITVENGSDLPLATAAEDGGDGPESRRRWFVDELKMGRKLRRSDLEDRFGISTATAKRDIADLGAGIEFVGTGKAGYYVAVRNP